LEIVDAEMLVGSENSLRMANGSCYTGAMGYSFL